MNGPGRVRVAGVGSFSGDDAVAWEVVRKLQEQIELGSGAGSKSIEFHMVEGGHRLLDILDGQGTLVLIDALAGEIGESPGAPAPGSILRLDWPDPRLDFLRPGTTHQLGPAESLQLAATLGLLPPRVVIWGIAGECFDPRPGLSPAVAAAVLELVQRIARELAEIYPAAGFPATH
jgi:hydrogenase maturation protease